MDTNFHIILLTVFLTLGVFFSVSNPTENENKLYFN